MVDVKTFNHEEDDNKKTEIGNDESSNNNKDIYVVGIGASAGGVEALEQFFTHLPTVDNMAFVVIQHLSPDFKSLMPDILSRNTVMKVYQIQNGMEIEPGCVYLNPPKYTVTIANNRLILTEQEKSHKINLSINIFLESLAREKGEKSIGIILSGTGSDGTRGCRTIKELGGIVISQDEKTAKFNGMPRSVISSNICDFILPPQAIPEKILNYTGQSSSLCVLNTDTKDEDASANILTKIFSIVESQHSINFGLYKQSTVLRCLDRRARICQVETLEDYYKYLTDNVEEVTSFYNSLLIGVTRFFRDKEAFGVIKEKVIPEIIKNKEDNAVIKVWVAGCSTGEEAYSLAILFREYMDLIQKNITVKIFATDIDNKAIEYASLGVYNDSIAEDVAIERLNRYFIRRRDGFHVTKHIREMVIFSVHDLTNNPPFYRLDLLSCRNLLIYFQPKLQNKIISNFQFGLNKNGFMFLGTSETAGELSNYFSIFDAKWKIFKKKDMKKSPLIDNYSIIPNTIKVIHNRTEEEHSTGLKINNWKLDEIFENLVEEYLPPSVVTDEYGDLIHVCGEGNKYLKVPRGRATNNIQKMVPKELSTALGTAMGKVRKEKKEITYRNIKIVVNNDEISLNLVVKPMLTRKNGLLIVVIFEEIKDVISRIVEHVENYDTLGELYERISDLEQELQYTKESLQTSIEEVETSSEELQSANEELLVSNEELHSTNEELQSVNEELMIVNTQYQYKIQELADLNNDMSNFLNSTTIGTIFLDYNLHVKKFTPSITKEINLIEQDIGRPISHISHNLKGVDLVHEASEIIGSLIPKEREVQSQDNKWYIIKYAPYRTTENTIKGIVISLVDISARKKAEESLKRSKDHYEKLVELSPFAIMITSNDKIQFSNTAGLNLLQPASSVNIIGKYIYEFLDIDEQQIILNRKKYSRKSEKMTTVLDRAIRVKNSDCYVDIVSMPISNTSKKSQLIILRDVTSEIIEDQLRKENLEKERLINEAQALDSIKNDFFSNLSHELRTPLNVIMSALQLLEKENKELGDEHQNKHLNIMRQNCYRQLRLVNNMIDITKIDSGFFEIKMQNHNIVIIVESIALSVAEYIKNNGIELIFDTNVEDKIMAFDLDSIERIMLNLLSNAVKFTAVGGQINVTIHDNGDFVTIIVKDSGVGIPKEKQDIIFDRFRQADKLLTKGHEGSGIGLALVKSLVEMHDGSIRVQSEIGKGTEFIIEMPVKKVEDEEEFKSEQSMTQNNVQNINIEFADIYKIK